MLDGGGDCWEWQASYCKCREVFQAGTYICTCDEVENLVLWPSAISRLPIATEPACTPALSRSHHIYISIHTSPPPSLSFYPSPRKKWLLAMFPTHSPSSSLAHLWNSITQEPASCRPTDWYYVTTNEDPPCPFSPHPSSIIQTSSKQVQGSVDSTWSTATNPDPSTSISRHCTSDSGTPGSNQLMYLESPEVWPESANQHNYMYRPGLRVEARVLRVLCLNSH